MVIYTGLYKVTLCSTHGVVDMQTHHVACNDVAELYAICQGVYPKMRIMEVYEVTHRLVVSTHSMTEGSDD